MPSATQSASSAAPWSTQYDTLKRQHLFKNPPKDKTAYPTLAAVIAPHVESFNNIFAENGQLHHALKDIGTKTFFDGNPNPPAGQSTPNRNRFDVRVTEVSLEKSFLPVTNKLDRNREILPVECRERHVSYRGRFRGRLQWRINGGEWKETLREFGLMPIMLKVCCMLCDTRSSRSLHHTNLSSASQIDVILKDFHHSNLLRREKRRKSLEDISSSTVSKSWFECLSSTAETTPWPSSALHSSTEEAHTPNSVSKSAASDRIKLRKPMSCITSTMATSHSDFPGERTNILYLS